MKTKMIGGWALVFFLISGIFFGHTSFAQEASNGGAKLTVKNLSLESGFRAEEQTISGSFSVSGGADVGDLSYALSLILPQKNAISKTDALVAFVFSPEQTVLAREKKIDFSLPWPKNIPSGVFELRVDVYDSRGALVAFDARQLPRQKSGDYHQLGNKFLAWNASEKLAPEKMVFGTDEQVFLGAEIFSLSSAGKTGLAKIVVRENDFRGKVILDFETEKKELSAGEMRFALKKQVLPEGKYFASWQLFNEENEPISNILHYFFITEKDYTNSQDLAHIFSLSEKGEKETGAVRTDLNDPGQDDVLASVLQKTAQEKIQKERRLKGLKMGGIILVSLFLLGGVAYYLSRYRIRKSYYQEIPLLILLISGLFAFSSGANAFTATLCVRSELNYYLNGEQKYRANIDGAINGVSISESCEPFSGLPAEGTFPISPAWPVAGNDKVIYQEGAKQVRLTFSNGSLSSYTVPGYNYGDVTMNLARLTLNVTDCETKEALPGATVHLDQARSTLSGSSWTGEVLPGVYRLTYFSKDGYENSDAKDLFLSSGNNGTSEYCLKRKKGSVRIFTGLGAGCNMGSAGVSGVSVELRKNSNPSIPIKNSTDSQGFLTITDLDSDNTNPTYIATAFSGDYQDPPAQNIIVDANSTRDYVFCMVPRAGTIGYTWNPSHLDEIGTSGTVQFRASLSNNSATTVKDFRLHFFFDGIEVGSDVHDIPPFSAAPVNYAVDHSYSGLASGGNVSIKLAYSGPGIPLSDFESRVLRVVSGTRLAGTVKDCKTGEWIQSSLADANAKVELNINGVSLPMNVAANGVFSVRRSGVNPTDSMFVSRVGFEPSAVQTSALSPFGYFNEFCMNRQTGSLVAEVRSGFNMANKLVQFSYTDPVTKNNVGIFAMTNINGFTGGVGIPVENYGDMTASYGGLSGIADPSPVRIFANSTTAAVFALSGGGACNNNGIVDAGEVCDNGALNGVCPAICSTNCTLNACGGSGVCTGTAPNGMTQQKCAGTLEAGLAADEAWRNVGIATDCPGDGKCEYYTSCVDNGSKACIEDVANFCSNPANCGKKSTYYCRNNCGSVVACNGSCLSVKCDSCNSGNWIEIAP